MSEAERLLKDRIDLSLEVPSERNLIIENQIAIMEALREMLARHVIEDAQQTRTLPLPEGSYVILRNEDGNKWRRVEGGKLVATKRPGLEPIW